MGAQNTSTEFLREEVELEPNPPHLYSGVKGSVVNEVYKWIEWLVT